MKKVLFDLTDCQPLRDVKFHGGGIYGFIVFKHLISSYGEKVVAYLNKDRYLPADVQNLIEKYNVQVIDSAERSLLSIFEEKLCAALYSPLYKDEYTKLFPLNIPITVTIHGLRALEMNRDRYEYIYASDFKTKVKSLIKQTPYFKVLENKYRARYEALFAYPYLKVITVSEHSKFSIQSFYPSIDSSRISIRYSPSTTDEKSYSELVGLPHSRGYYMMISANRWLKNVYRAVRALDYLYENKLLTRPTHIVGINENNRMFKSVHNKDMFICQQYLEKEELEQLYADSYAFIYPSLNEGFGYPPLEAMKYKVPCITSPFASIPEVCKDAVIYTNPYSEMEIANRILQLEDKECYKTYSQKGYERYCEVQDKQNADLDQLVEDILSSVEN